VGVSTKLFAWFEARLFGAILTQKIDTVFWLTAESNFAHFKSTNTLKIASKGCAASLFLAVAAWGQSYWPTSDWRASTPEQQGIDSEKLNEAFDYIRQHDVNIHSLLMVRNGYIVLDSYFYPFARDELHDVASVTKSLTSTLVGIAVDEGKIKSLDQPVLFFFPEVSVAGNGDRKQSLKIENLLTMTSGLQSDLENDEEALRQMRQSGNWTKFMLDQPMADEPGSKFVYCSGGMHLLSGVISHVTGESEAGFARHSLFEPLGIQDEIWPADPQGVTHGWGDLHLHPRDMAKIGYLWLNRGMWNGRRLLSADWMDRATQVHARAGDQEYGYGFWIRPDAALYEALGRGGQRICVLPSKKVIVVFTGGNFEPGNVGKFLLAAIQSENPLPANPSAVARLEDSVNQATMAPQPKRVPAPPPMASRISGKAFEFGQNPAGLKELALTFNPGGEASVRLAFADHRFTDTPVSERPVGLDGVPRISPHGRCDLPVGIKGSWKDDQTFLLDYDEIANINHYQFELTFSGTDVSVVITEKTGAADLSFSGNLREN
jgi:CubicO group peptidase (beta-lactamase class C family)